MFLVAVFLLAAYSELVFGQPETSTLIEGKRPHSKDSILDTCQALKDDAQVMRHEGYSAIDKADKIREQAYHVKDEAYEIKDEAYEIKEIALEARSALEATLVESLALMKNQATASNLYIQEIRTSLSSVLTRMDRLEQGLKDVGQGLGDVEQELEDVGQGLGDVEQGLEDVEQELEDVGQGLEDIEQELEDVGQGQEQLEQTVDDKISELTQIVSDKLAEAETVSGELIPAARVEQSTTLPGHPVGPEKAVDGNLGTESHTVCDQPRPWFRYYFSGQRAVGQIKVVNGKLNQYKIRLNGVKVFVMAGDGQKRSCRVNTITVREGDFIAAQTYYLDCTGNTGIGVEFVLQTTNCLEFMEIEVYTP